jgi:hypothetical protein
MTGKNIDKKGLARLAECHCNCWMSNILGTRFTERCEYQYLRGYRYAQSQAGAATDAKAGLDMHGAGGAITRPKKIEQRHSAVV